MRQQKKDEDENMDTDSLKTGGRNGDTTNKWIGAKFDTEDPNENQFVEAFDAISKKVGGGGNKFLIGYMIAMTAKQLGVD